MKSVQINDSIYTILEMDAGDMKPERYLQKLIVENHIDCPYMRVIQAFESKLNTISAAAHSAGGHCPEYSVMLIELNNIKKEYLGEL